MTPVILEEVVIKVIDGDTITLADGTRIRIFGIEANETRGGCHLPVCAPRSAAEARDNLIDLALYKRVTYQPVGRSWNRVVARVWVNGVDVGCAQVEGGFAVTWAAYLPKGRKVCE